MIGVPATMNDNGKVEWRVRCWAAGLNGERCFTVIVVIEMTENTIKKKDDENTINNNEQLAWTGSSVLP